MPDYKGKYHSQVFKGLALIMGRNGSDQKEQEITYYSSLPQDGNAPEPLNETQANIALINGDPIVAYSKAFGYVPFGRIGRDIVYGDDYLSHSIAVPEAPAKPDFFWSGFLNMFGYKTEEQEDYDSDLSHYNEVSARAANLEVLRQHRSELTDIEKQYRDFEALYQDTENQISERVDRKSQEAREKALQEAHEKDDLNENLRIDDIVAPNFEKVDRESVLTYDDRVTEGKMKQLNEVLSEDDGSKLQAMRNILIEEKKIVPDAPEPPRTAPPSKEEIVPSPKETKAEASVPHSIAASAQQHKDFFDLMTQSFPELAEVATGKDPNANPSVSNKDALAGLTMKVNHINAFDAAERVEFNFNMDDWLAEHRDEFRNIIDSADKLNPKEKEAYKNLLTNLSGKELGDRLAMMQITNIAVYEGLVPLKDWPEERADKTELNQPATPEETAESREGQKFLAQRQAEAYAALKNENASKETVGKALATIMVCASLFERSPELAKALTLNQYGFSSMPQDVPRVNKLNQLIADQMRNNIRAREQFSSAHPEKFDTAVKVFSSQPGFQDLVGKEQNLSSCRAALCKYYADPAASSPEQQFGQAKIESKVMGKIIAKTKELKKKEPAKNNSAHKNKVTEKSAETLQQQGKSAGNTFKK